MAWAELEESQPSEWAGRPLESCPSLFRHFAFQRFEFGVDF